MRVKPRALWALAAGCAAALLAARACCSGSSAGPPARAGAAAPNTVRESASGLARGGSPAGQDARSAPGSGAGAATSPQAAGSEHRPVPLDQWVDPSRLSPEEIEERRLARLAHAALSRQAYQQYPPHSRPMRENGDLAAPDHVEPTVRPLAGPGQPGSTPRALIRQTQSRVFLRPGSPVTVGLEAAVDGQPEPVHVISAQLVTWGGTPPAASAPLLEVAFAQAADRLAASFLPPEKALGGYTGDLLLRVEAEAAGERGALVYAFVYTGAPPAVFNGVTGDVVKDGSVLFTMSVQVTRPGRYRIVGRVDDSTGKALALARFDGDLTAATREVPLVLFGKIVHDEGGTAPFVLRDVEGFRLLDGVYPDRETMNLWPGPYRSRPYPPDALSSAPWDGGAGAGPRR